MRIVVLVSVLLLVAAACGGSSADDNSEDTGESDQVGELTGRTWVLDRLVVGGEDMADVVDAGATLRFDADGHLGGTGPCNTYGASYEIDGTTLELGDVESTLMACAEADRMAAETQFFEHLRSITAIEVGVDRVVLGSDDDTTMEWVPEAPVEDATLEGTEWVLDTFFGPGSDGSDAGATASSTLAGTEITLSFGDGQAGGSAGCNAYGAEVTIDGDAAGEGSIATGDVVSDGQACVEPPGVMEQEAEYVEALGAATSWRIEGERLRLSTPDGSGLGFRARATTTAGG